MAKQAPLARPEEPPRPEMVERLREQIGDLGSVILVGHSLGGYVTLSYALQYPEHVAGLVLLSTGPGFAKPEGIEAWNQWVTDGIAPDAPDQELLAYHYDSVVYERLSELEMPVVVLQGERDTRFDAARKVFEARLSRVESHVLADAGHNIHVKKPRQVAEIVLDWISRVELDSRPRP